MPQSRSGQILIELIVAVTIILFISVSIALAVSVSVRGSISAMEQTTAIYLSQGTVESVRAFTIANWHNLNDLATGTSNAYFPTSTAGAWTHATGTESLTIDGNDFTRWFWLSDVYRSTSTGDIVSTGGIWDPAVRKVTVQVDWISELTGANEFSQVYYVSRYSNAIYSQTDWSDGSVGEQTVTEATTTFATSTQVDFASTSGSLKLLEI